MSPCFSANNAVVHSKLGVGYRALGQVLSKSLVHERLREVGCCS